LLALSPAFLFLFLPFLFCPTPLLLRDCILYRPTDGIPFAGGSLVQRLKLLRRQLA